MANEISEHKMLYQPMLSSTNAESSFGNFTRQDKALMNADKEYEWNSLSI